VPVGGLSRSSAARAPPGKAGSRVMDGYHRWDDEPHELTCVDIDTFLATF